MPIYMDRHDAKGVTHEALADAHSKDLAAQEKHNVDFLTYWFDQEHDCIFCLAEAPDEESVKKVHAEAHGMIPQDIIEVELSAVEAFLGRAKDPKPEKSADGKEHLHMDGSFRSILFTDLKGSTSMSSTIGDRAAIDLLDSHDRIIRGMLTAYHGREVKHTGDGFMAAFTDVTRSVNCGAAIQRAFHEFNDGGPQIPLQVRLGINAGLPVERGKDLFGITVQLAARVCDHAKADQILVTGVISELFKDNGLKLTKQTEKARFKGFDYALQLYEVEWKTN